MALISPSGGSPPPDRQQTGVRVVCTTVEKGFDGELWPTWLQCPPVKDERVMTQSGRALKVRNITHAYNGDILVELVKL
jgi:hypothetical protein